MKIQEVFDQYLEKIKKAMVVALADDEGEIILYSYDEDRISDEDVRLFAAHVVHTMAKKINGKESREIFLYNDKNAVFAKKLKDNLVILIVFEGRSFRGYADLYAEEIIEKVEEEFF
ncbi:hypothetical protein TTHT_0902 [Thermotomaculum hydrothermale]|uniref:Roadblock/LC7 family protein n=1 Tax=Thermotomaculum hydrothermale TaxID=981385 RepID=A0A7R6PZA9_9BACT|nr:hypothetical protein [Thermotomaculum hydrothermale]BBB32458.1 hypothetical protein TTHT_0902 [Thermotomaculum hydrothermale]